MSKFCSLKSSSSGPRAGIEDVAAVGFWDGAVLGCAHSPHPLCRVLGRGCLLYFPLFFFLPEIEELLVELFLNICFILPRVAFLSAGD